MSEFSSVCIAVVLHRKKRCGGTPLPVSMSGQGPLGVLATSLANIIQQQPRQVAGQAAGSQHHAMADALSAAFPCAASCRYEPHTAQILLTTCGPVADDSCSTAGMGRQPRCYNAFIRIQR